MRDFHQLRTELYPPIEPYARGRLQLDDLHTMYWEQSGNPRGIPVLYLHGGPGGGSNARMRQFFDPAVYRIVLYDQRGAGRSTPSGEIRNNTTPLLIDDIERLRTLLQIDRWMVFGGSWGATLALAYGEAHALRCLGFVLRGIFLGGRDEIDWFLYGMRQVFPEAWRALVAAVPEAARRSLDHWYYARLTDADPAVHLPAARAWSRYEASCSTLLPQPALQNMTEKDDAALAIARIEAHYFVHDAFLARDSLIANLERIRHLPLYVVQGRYDMVCPVASADRLVAHWPGAQYVVVADAGHSAWEPGIMAELVKANETMKRTLHEVRSHSPQGERHAGQ